MYDSNHDSGFERSYYSYSIPEPKKPEPPKKKGSFLKKALLSMSLGLLFGLFAGTGWFAVNAAIGLFMPEKEQQSQEAISEVLPGEQPAAPEPKREASTAQLNSLPYTGVTDVVDNVMPSVVSITNMFTQTMNFWGREAYTENESSGSGIIVGQNDKELLIVTNNHVVENADTLMVQFIDDNMAEAQLKGTDSAIDLAVIAVPLDSIDQETKDQIKIATLGNSDDLRVGQTAIAIGNSLGYGQSVTTGVISALNREITMENITNELIQTDAAINPGNSGGALLNEQGEVIGINAAKFGGTDVEGMGYAIPISQAKPIIDQLINKETKIKVDDSESSYLGISGVDVNEQVSEAYGMPIGVYVAQVYEGTAADDAGIVKGDIITEFDGEKIRSMADLTSQMQYYSAGTSVKIKLQSGVGNSYQEKEVTVVLGKKVS